MSGNCLNCVNAGNDFCSAGPAFTTVDPINGICCAGMTTGYGTCNAQYPACTYTSTYYTRFSKFYQCRPNSQCLKQTGLNGFTVQAFNTEPQTITLNKVLDVGPCKYVMLNSMNYPAYINLTTDSTANTVAFYAPITNYMLPNQYIPQSQTQLLPGVVTKLEPNTHYQFGVVTLLSGVSYSLTFWRDSSEYA